MKTYYYYGTGTTYVNIETVPTNIVLSLYVGVKNKLTLPCFEWNIGVLSGSNSQMRISGLLYLW